MAVVYSAEKTLRVLVIARSSRKWSRTAIRLEGLRQTKLDTRQNDCPPRMVSIAKNATPHHIWAFITGERSGEEERTKEHTILVGISYGIIRRGAETPPIDPKTIWKASNNDLPQSAPVVSVWRGDQGGDHGLALFYPVWVILQRTWCGMWGKATWEFLVADQPWCRYSSIFLVQPLVVKSDATYERFTANERRAANSGQSNWE